MASQRVSQLSEARIWGSDEQVTVKIWGSNEQVIGVSSNSSAGVSYLSLTYPLTVNHFLNRAIYPTARLPKTSLISHNVAAYRKRTTHYVLYGED